MVNNKEEYGRARFDQNSSSSPEAGQDLTTFDHQSNFTPGTAALKTSAGSDLDPGTTANSDPDVEGLKVTLQKTETGFRITIDKTEQENRLKQEKGRDRRKRRDIMVKYGEREGGREGGTEGGSRGDTLFLTL